MTKTKTKTKQKTCLYYVPDPLTGMPLTVGLRHRAALNYAETRTLMTDVQHYAVKGDPYIPNDNLRDMIERIEFETTITGLLSKLDGGEE